jgi:serine/threonine protein kinase
VVAIKKQAPDPPSRDEKEKHIYNEVNIVSETSHKNIVRCLGYCHEIKVALACLDDEYAGDKQPTYCFVEEYMRNGSMYGFITQGSICIAAEIQITVHRQKKMHLLTLCKFICL